MANEQQIADLITESSKKSLTDAQKYSEALNQTLQKTIVLRKELNDTMVGAKTMGDVNAIAVKEQKAIEQTNKLIAQRQLAEEKLAAFQAAQQAKLDAAEAKQLKADADKIARIKRIEEAETIRAKKKADLDAQELANSKQISAAEANEATAIGRTEQAEKKRTGTKKLSNLEQEKANQLAKVDRLNLVAQAKEGNAVKGSLEQRALALARLQKTYSLLDASERNSPFGARLAKTIPQLNAQVLTLESSLGKSQRNVGNYGNAFTKAFGGIRTLANILPGIGISGIFLAAYEGIKALAEGLDLFTTASSKAKLSQETLEKAISSSSYTDAVKNLSELRINIQLAKDGFIDKESVLKQYNETIGQTTGQVKTLDEAEKALAKNADNFIRVTLYKAAAQLALEEAAKQAYEAEITGRKQLEEFSNAAVDTRFGNGGVAGLGTGQFNAKEYEKETQRINTARKKRQNDAIKISTDAEEKQIQIATSFQKKAALLSSQSGFKNFLGNDEKPKKGKDNSKEREKDARDSAAALVQIEIDANKKIAEVYKSQVENQNFSQEARLSALQNFTATQLTIAKLEGEKEKAAKKLNAGELLKVDADYQNKVVDANKSSSEKTLEILRYTAEEAERIRIYQGQRTLTLIEKARDEEIITLINSYQKTGDYSAKAQEVFEQKRLEIVRKYGLKEVDEQILQAQKLIEIRKAQGFDVAKEERDLSALILKAKELELQGIDKYNKDRLDKEKQNAEALKEVAQEVFDFSRSLTAQIFEGNISNLEEEKDARQRNTDLQIENVNESVKSEQEKADQIALINAQNTQQQEALDARIKEQKRKAAIADKAFAIAQIGINTAVAVSKALAQTGVLGAFVIPGIIALGAIQLASVIATPIPKFKDGKSKGNNYEGLAYVGDGGQSELVINKDGSSWVTPATSTLTYVEKDTQVISGPELARMRMMAKPDGTDVVGKSWDVSPLIAESQRSTKEMKKAIGQLVTKQKRNNRVFDMQSWNAHLKRNGF